MRIVAALTLALLLSAACERSRTERGRPVRMETVDVDSGIDTDLSTEDDQRGRQTEPELAGVLPSDFPTGLPVFSPGSIVDFGPGFVDVDTPVPPSEVRSSIDAQLARAGWAAAPSIEGAQTFTRAGSTVRIVLSAIGSGTRIRYEY